MADGKQTVQDWAEGLSRRSKISRAKSDSFLRAFFSLVKKGLTEENFVKIKGLGTFKLVSVGSRESIDVNTGQRIEIGEHQRLLFTPDKAMKERVNRPFEQFDTIVIEDDSIDLENIDRQAAEYEIRAEVHVEDKTEIRDHAATKEKTLSKEETLTAIPVQEEPPLISSEPMPEKASADSPLEIQSLSLTEPSSKKSVEKGKLPEPTTTSSEEVKQVAAVAASLPADEQEGMRLPRTRRHFSVFCIILGFIIIASGSYMMGYFHVFERRNATVETVRPKRPVVAPSHKQKQVMPKLKHRKQPDKATQVEEDVLELSKKFKQLPGGKFLIVGTLKTHRMKVGDNLLRLSRQIFGSKDYVDYIIFYNGLKNPDVVPLGTDLKIPRLAHKPGYDKEHQ